MLHWGSGTRTDCRCEEGHVRLVRWMSEKGFWRYPVNQTVSEWENGRRGIGPHFELLLMVVQIVVANGQVVCMYRYSHS